MKNMNGYDLSRHWFDFAFENPEKINPNHAAIYFFAIEHCNRLGWKEKFGFPTQMAMDAIGIRKHQTYIKYFNDLIDWGFFKLIQKSTNQYSANIISLQNAKPENGKALCKAIGKHRAKQKESIRQSTGQSKGSIDKPENYKPKNQGTRDARAKFQMRVLDFQRDVFRYTASNLIPDNIAEDFFNYWSEETTGKGAKKMRWETQKTFSIANRLGTWIKKEKEFAAKGGKKSRQQEVLEDIQTNPIFHRP